MTRPIINPASDIIFRAIVDHLPQSLLLTGEDGIGLSTISKYIAEIRKTKPTIVLPEKDEKVDLTNGVISVDSMRRLYNETRTISVTERIIIIDYAERMTNQSQNAFLKLLEEPGSGVYFILVSHSQDKLLPTIISRVENISIKRATAEQSQKLLDVLGITDITKRSQLLFMAEGLPAELTRLASNDQYFERRSAIVRDARDLLRGTLYRKLLIVQRYKDDRPAVLSLLTDAAKILQKSIAANPQSSTIKHIDVLIKAYRRIEANGNIRICLAHMVVKPQK